MGRLLGILLLVLTVCTIACGGSPGTPVFVRARLDSKRFSLANGLEVVLHPDSSFRSVTVNVRYEVGSRHDPAGASGLAHLVEHLTFRTKPDGTHDAFTLLEQAGSSSHNAETTVDATSYYETVPAEALPVALFIEAARMARPLDGVDEAAFAIERNVVRNERRERIENVPYGNLDGLALFLLFEGSSYGTPTIGLAQELDRLTLEHARRFVSAWYRPNNATLVVAGGFDPLRVTALIHELFDAIPAARIANVGVVPDPTSQENVRWVTEAGVDAPAVALAWGIPAPGQRGWHEMVLAEECFPSAIKHRFGAAARRIRADVIPRDEQSVFLVHAELAPNATASAFVDAVESELREMSREHFASVLGSEKSRVIAQRTLDLEQIDERARVLQAFVARYDRADSIQAELHAFSMVTQSDFAQAIDQYLLRGRRITVEALPKPGAPRAGSWNVRRAGE